MEEKITVHWFRRDLRLHDNVSLHKALQSNNKVLPLFIFDDELLDDLPKNDARVSFIHKELKKIDLELKKNGSSLLVLKGNPLNIWEKIIQEYRIYKVFFNHDYEPYAKERDEKVKNLLKQHNIKCESFKDQVIFEKNDILKNDGKPYTVYTPYKNKWLAKFNEAEMKPCDNANKKNFLKVNFKFPKLIEIGFTESAIKIPPFNADTIKNYKETRDFPALRGTSMLGTHLRFGTLSIREIVRQIRHEEITFLQELIWREFFMQILYHFPRVEHENFKKQYDFIKWRNNEKEFEAWKNGMTGYPIVDAGMRELNATGFMHNRVRMVTASFLTKHFLIDWRLGEAYFALKLNDYDLASNNGNWQWAAGTGCDAAPYFRIFNPYEQAKKFDPESQYIKRWVPEYGTKKYSPPIIEHKFARLRALNAYKKGLSDFKSI